MESLRLYKTEKLCSKIEIDKLYREGTSVIAYPLRAVFLVVPPRPDKRQVPARFLISIPKKRIRHAVDRVTLRRRTRESFRLNRHLLYPTATSHNVTVLIGFNWLAQRSYDYAAIERRMQELLTRIAQSITPSPASNHVTEP